MSLPDPHLFHFLTRDEFKLVFSVAFLQQSDTYADCCYDQARYASPGAEDIHSWEELFRRAIRWLALEVGFRFQGLEAFEDGRINAGRPIQPENEMYRLAMRQGDLPDVGHAIETALRMVDELGLKINTEPLKGCLADVEQHLAETASRVDRVDLEKLDNFRRHALDSIGVREVN